MSTELRFGLTFMVLFVALTGAFELSRGSAFEKFVVEDLIVSPTAALLNTLMPNERVEIHGRTLVTPTSKLNVTRGCEGVEMFLLLAAAILSFRATLARRAQGFLLGGALAYALSIARLAVLDYALRFWPHGWEALHGLILPLAPIAVLVLFFIRWTAWTSAAARNDARIVHAP